MSTTTGELLRAINARADALGEADRAAFGRSVLYLGAAITGLAQGAEVLAATLEGMAVSARAAIREGEQDG